MMVKFDNDVSITVLSGKTGDVTYQYDAPNAISDDILATLGHVFYTPLANATSAPYCFILPDGAQWSGFTYDRQNPWAPYCLTANNLVDITADPQWKARTTYTAPSNTVTGKHKLFFQWSNLPFDFQLKAIGLTGFQSDSAPAGDIADYNFGAGNSVNQQATVIIPQTLLVLGSSVLVHGRNGGAGTPDILQVSYFLSIVGTS